MNPPRINFGDGIVLKVTAPPLVALLPETLEIPGHPALGDPDARVLHSTRLRLATIVALKQAGFWKPGFVEQEFIEEAIATALALLPESHQPLPAKNLDKLLITNKKLRR